MVFRLCLIIVCLSCSFSFVFGDEANSNLIGKWRVVSSKQNGSVIPSDKDVIVEFTSEHLKAKLRPGSADLNSYVIDSNSEPARLTIFSNANNSKFTELDGIFTIHKNRLIYCCIEPAFKSDPFTGRVATFPSSFETKAGDMRRLIVFERTEDLRPLCEPHFFIYCLIRRAEGRLNFFGMRKQTDGEQEAKERWQRIWVATRELCRLN
jgi:uncharacterized protein (TIGR03067 family)